MNENKINEFINTFINEHSWYKHLFDERSTPFIFYINSECDFEYIMDENVEINFDFGKTKLSSFQIEFGKFYMSKFIYGNFSRIDDCFYNSKSFKMLHFEILKDFQIHLKKIINQSE
jgi:hypothetical protein